MMIDVSDARPSRAQVDASCGMLTVGTRVLTACGKVPAEELEVGDRILTKDFGFQHLKSITLSTMSSENGALLDPVRLQKDCLGPDRPSRDVYVASDQKIAIKHPMFDMLFGSREVLMRAGDMTTLPGVNTVPALDGTTYIELGFKRPQIVFADGLHCEVNPLGLGSGRCTLSHKEAALACSILLPRNAANALIHRLALH